jgi:hypothetical protein
LVAVSSVHAGLEVAGSASRLVVTAGLHIPEKCFAKLNDCLLVGDEIQQVISHDARRTIRQDRIRRGLERLHQQSRQHRRNRRARRSPYRTKSCGATISLCLRR